jgi:hypothetical protein
MPQMLVRPIQGGDRDLPMTRFVDIGGVWNERPADLASLQQILPGQPDRAVDRDLGEFLDRHRQDVNFVQRSDFVCHRH